ncbi:MAG: DUF1657 domain-containing protein [Bacillus thermozeamaize]|uniref:DUF1657 domain-containing protein n=1 Tax=Bacillus thermozeamaize TaxID=230954 RepID=A0A1Y3PU20_9BACI|nr:MAG: DUF1657 domain-containing protein [Bacillus thermozeamaize]
MTVGTQVKKTAVLLKGIEATIRAYAETTQHPEAKEIWSRQIPRVEEVIDQLEKRVQTLEREEPQYKGY